LALNDANFRNLFYTASVGFLCRTLYSVIIDVCEMIVSEILSCWAEESCKVASVVHKCLELFTAVDFVCVVIRENAAENMHVW